MNPDNPILPEVARLLRADSVALSEYELIKRLNSDDLFPPECTQCDSSLRNYKQHFLVMNALYTLQQTWLNDGRVVTISPLSISVSKAADIPGQALDEAAVTPALATFYLDWANYDIAATEIEAMLKGFWQRYHALDKRGEALLTLGLDADADLAGIEKAYRKLANNHHPDKGGSKAQFQVVREAYEILKKSM